MRKEEEKGSNPLRQSFQPEPYSYITNRMSTAYPPTNSMMTP